MMEIIRSIQCFFNDRFRFWEAGKGIRILFTACLLLPVLLVLVFFAMGPLFQAPFDRDAGNPAPAGVKDPSLFVLKLDQCFLQSQLAEAKSDSIHLVVNLQDSTCALQIRGVKIRECRITRYWMSRAVWRNADRPEIHGWLGRPFHARRQWATLPKAPIKIRKAPRDTTEANRIPDSTVPVEHVDVGFTLLFDRNLSLEIIQAERFSFSGFFKKGWYRARGTIVRFGEEVEAAVRGRIPRPSMRIRLVMARNDAKAVYRALPQNAGLVLRIPSP
ncbi:hypothetical protein JW906_11380 [bacterium]|nr:hypothetical protein [bacterium]